MSQDGQLAVLDGPEVPGGDQHEPKGRQLAIPDGGEVPGGGEQMPEHLIIGTKQAFDKGYAFSYRKKQIGPETVYVCCKGSEWARVGEVLVLQYVHGCWTASDSCVSVDGSILHCRQNVFRCSQTNITQPGLHCWETNGAVSMNNTGFTENWHGELWVETRVP